MLASYCPNCQHGDLLVWIPDVPLSRDAFSPYGFHSDLKLISGELGEIPSWKVCSISPTNQAVSHAHQLLVTHWVTFTAIVGAITFSLWGIWNHS